jgi:hypothetical protein
MNGHKALTMSTVNNGAAEELFQRELAEVMRNVDDCNTAPKEPRKITMEFIFTPNETRELGVLEVSAKSKLAPYKAAGSTFILQNNGKQLCPWEPDVHQPAFDFGDNVSKIDAKTKAAGERDDD